MQIERNEVSQIHCRSGEDPVVISTCGTLLLVGVPSLNLGNQGKVPTVSTCRQSQVPGKGPRAVAWGRWVGASHCSFSCAFSSIKCIRVLARAQGHVVSRALAADIGLTTPNRCMAPKGGGRRGFFFSGETSCCSAVLPRIPVAMAIIGAEEHLDEQKQG